MFVLFALAACGVGNLNVNSKAEGCTNYNFDDPAESTIESSIDGSTAKVWRTYVERENSDDVFAPEIDGDGTILTVQEKWENGSDGLAMCIQPTVTIGGLEGTLEVEWYVADQNIPLDTIEVSPE